MRISSAGFFPLDTVFTAAWRASFSIFASVLRVRAALRGVCGGLLGGHLVSCRTRASLRAALAALFFACARRSGDAAARLPPATRLAGGRRSSRAGAALARRAGGRGGSSSAMLHEVRQRVGESLLRPSPSVRPRIFADRLRHLRDVALEDHGAAARSSRPARARGGASRACARTPGRASFISLHELVVVGDRLLRLARERHPHAREVDDDRERRRPGASPSAATARSASSSCRRPPR